MLAGIYQILQTPFDDSGDIDWDSLARQIDFCFSAGVHGMVIPALASEFFALSDAERLRLVEFTGAEIAGRVPFVVGVQGLNLRLALEFARHARDNRATAPSIAAISDVAEESGRARASSRDTASLPDMT